MKIALGADHRGGKIAGFLLRNVFSRDHYVGERQEAELKKELVGAVLIENATSSDEFSGEVCSTVEPLVYSKSDAAQCASRPGGGIDYPDVAAAVAEAVATGRADYGALICGTGIGMCITANKFPGVRAALCGTSVAAELSRRHNDANILCLSGESMGEAAVENIVRIWLKTPFDGGRHQRRLDKIAAIEKGVSAEDVEAMQGSAGRL